MLTSDLFENKTPAAWRAGYERGLKYYLKGPTNPYKSGTEEHKDFDDGYHHGELDGREKYNSRTDEGSLNEFAPGSGGDDDIGDDPYKYPEPKRYGRSVNFFGQFEADHFDREDMNDATGEFKGYWNSDGKPKQIAYFKFDDPARTGSDDSGMGWYYEPQSDSRSDNVSAEPAVDNFKKLKQQELDMIRAFLKSGNRPSPGSQIYQLMKKHGIEEGQDNSYGYQVGQTVKLQNGSQGQVLDIFDDSIEVLLVGGRTVTVDFRDAQVISEQGVAEGSDYSAVTNAVTRRIIHQHPQVLAKYGPVVVGQAIDEIAEFVGDVDEIGSSDVSGWTSQVIRSLARFAPLGDNSLAEGSLEEIDRRGFLKGAITAAMAGAAGGSNAYSIDYRRGPANALELSDTEANALINAISVYFLIQKGYIEPNPRLNQTLQTITKIDPAFKDRMNLIYDNVKDSFGRVFNQDIKKFNNSVNSYKQNQETIIQDLSAIQRPFESIDQSVEEGVVDTLKGAWEKIKNFDNPARQQSNQELRKKQQLRRKEIKNQDMSEENLTEQDLAEAVSTLELADILFKGLEQKFPKIIERYGHEVVGNAIMDVAEENLDVSSFSEIDMLIDDIIEKLQNYNGNDSGLTESTVSRLYYNVVGTSAPELRKDFGMRHDRRGWFLSESSGRNRIMDAQRAFGSPKLVEYSVSDATGGAAQLGPDNVISPVGSVPKSQRINTKKARK